MKSGNVNFFQFCIGFCQIPLLTKIQTSKIMTKRYLYDKKWSSVINENISNIDLYNRTVDNIPKIWFSQISDIRSIFQVSFKHSKNVNPATSDSRDVIIYNYSYLFFNFYLLDNFDRPILSTGQ